MTTTLARTARPPRAAIAWVQDGSLFVEYPTPSGVPYVVRHHLTLTDLTGALNILIAKSEAAPPTPRSTAAPHPSVRRPKPEFTVDERDGIRAILKAKGIL